MSDNELLLAISDMLDKKLKADMEPLKDEIKKLKLHIENVTDRNVEQLRDEVKCIKLHMENVTDRNIQLLAENYVPAVKKFEKNAELIEAMQEDITLLKKVVSEHSEKLQKIS